MSEFRTVTRGDEASVMAARELFQEYRRELGIDLCFQGFEEEIATLPGKYAPPWGLLILACEGEEAVACGALRPLEESVSEIKRIYVRPEARRRGLARSISELLIVGARDIGYERVRLDTLRRLTGAVELYEHLGFVQIEPYNFNPEPDIVYMELAF